MFRKAKPFFQAGRGALPAICLLSAATAVLQGANLPPVAGDVQFPAEETKFTAKEWKLQPFEPEDVKRRVQDVSIDDFGDDLGGGLALDDGPSDKAQSKDEPPPLQWPTEADAYWGWFRFQSGAWWSTTMLMKEANTLQFELPRAGVEHEQHGYNNVWLRTFETIDPSWRGKGVSFVIDGLTGCDANLYVNRKLAGTIHRPGGELDISDLVTPGEKNELLLLVSANGYQIAPVTKDTYTGLSKGGGYKPHGSHNFNITGPKPRLLVRPPVAITDVFANTSWREKKLKVEVEVATAGKLDGTLLAEVYDADGRLVKSLETPIPAKALAAKPGGRTSVVGEIPWDDPITWEFGRGYLYTLRTRLDLAGGMKLGYRDVRFGFREIWRDGRKIYMNGHEQKFRMCYNFGAGIMGAEFLSSLGYNVIQYAHNNRDTNPDYSADLLYGLAERGIGCAIAAPQIFYGKREALVSSKEVRADYNGLLARNLRRYRNIPSVVMCYVGVNINIQNWTQDALYLGSYSNGKFDILINEVAAEAKKTNPNVLFYSHGDGINGDIATANLYFNWIPLQEREEWPSRWAVRGTIPFQAAEFGHPYQMTWGREGCHDAVSELLAIYYGDEAYREEPQSIRIRHGDQGLLYIRRMQHPLYWRFLDDFVWGLNRSWRTFGINGGVAWFNLDQGFGMPGWELDNIWNEYAPNYTDATFEKIGGVPKGRPEWAFPSWDIYQRGNKDFLGYIGGWPRHTDKRHAYAQGESVEKQIVMLDDSFAPGEYAARWRAYSWDEAGNELPIASGRIDRRQLESNVPLLEKISFAAPQVQGGAHRPPAPCRARIEVEFLDARDGDRPVAGDAFDFEVYPAPPPLQAPNGARVAIFDPLGLAGKWLDGHGVAGAREIKSLAPEAIGDATHLVIGPYALGSNDFPIASSAVGAGLKVLVMEQFAAAWSKMGFTPYDAAPRRLWLRDTSNPAFAGISDGDLHDWAGQPIVPPGTRVHDGQGIGHLTSGGGPRWTRNMAVAALVLRTPDIVGFRPQIEGEFDMNMSALLKFSCGRGSIQFCTLSLTGRTLPYPEASKDAPGRVEPAIDPAAERVARAVLNDFLSPVAEGNALAVEPLGRDAARLARECGAPVSAGGDGRRILLVGPDSGKDWKFVRDAAASGSPCIVFANPAIAQEAGFALGEATTNYCARFAPSNAILKGIGQNLLRWRSMMLVRPFATAPQGFETDANGLVAWGMDGKVVFTAIDPFQIERRLSDGEEIAAAGAAQDDVLADGLVAPDEPISLEDPDDEVKKAKEAEDGKASKAARLKAACLTIEHGYQFFSRLMTNLGAAPSPAALKPAGDGKGAYNLPLIPYAPYFFHYW